MRKISKISLVAAVAVAGFSTANAQPLEQAIKDVEVSGSVVYRYDNFHNAEKFSIDENGNRILTSERQNTDKNNYKIGLNLGSKVNDYVKFNSRFIVGSKDNAGFASLNSGKETTTRNGAEDNTKGNDGQADVSLSNAYFGLTAIPNTVVNIGKQGLTTPYTVATDINGNEQTGTGILALTTVGPVTGGLGYFNNTNLDKSTEINSTLGYGTGSSTKTFRSGDSAYGLINGGQDIYVATLQGNLDLVKLEAWYLGHQENFNTYTLAATSNIDLASDAKIGLEARYVNLKLTNDGVNGIANQIDPTGLLVTGNDIERDNSMFRLAADGKFNIVNARLAYTKTGKDGGLTALDQDAKNTSLGWALSSNGVADADYWQAALGADILDNLNFTLNYGNLKSGEVEATRTKAQVLVSDIKAQETYGQLTYKMSKNLNTYLRYGTVEIKENSTGNKLIDQNRGRIQVAYSF
ncbi:Campylo_MOMP domain-containing protein [Aliarcobacter cibarius]|uniref:major outer membrane protein n=1 Tax=Aliarcobacter cibarius TaxID=255507 RepID=UPI001248590A|nr:major outer membrane protein [Aliarcobacter cibarius]QEZ89827.1 Campylo_MOMP domain-containing protein [Aliarcobacter cibarius]